MEKDLITICIAAYNAAEFIGETLQSVKAQSYQNWELIIVEDGTSDNTKQIVNEFSNQVIQNVLYFRQENNLGISATRNKCVSFAKGNWIALLDSDDLWHKDHLSDLLSIAKIYSDCNLIHSAISVFDSYTKAIIHSEPLSTRAIKELPSSLFNGGYTIQPSAAMISAELYKLVNGFDPNLRYSEDIEMWIRCARAGSKFAFTGKTTCYYRRHTESLSRHTLSITTGIAEVYSRHTDWEEIPISIRMKQASNGWLAAARIVRKNDKGLARKYFSKSLNYQKTLKHFGFWILLQIS